MKLEPVYLLGPKPKPPSIPTRRAFMIAGGTFLAGIGLGGACGYAAGVSRSYGKADDETDPKRSGNAELDELRRLALKAPIAELVGKWLYFTDVYATSYRTDAYLPAGIERLADHILANADLAQRRMMARALKQVIELGEPVLQTRLQQHLPQLAKVR